MTAEDRNVHSLFSDARADEVLRRLELTVNRRLDGYLHGDHRGLVPGHGSEPGDTRSYQPGDDVRRIDWNVTARTSEPHLRETIADRELETWAFVDLSPSIHFGTAGCEKRELVLASFAAVGFLTARAGNRLGVVHTDGSSTSVHPARGGRMHLLAALRRLIEVHAPDTATEERTDLSDGLRQLRTLARRRGLVVVLSDFLADGWEQALGALGVRHELLAVEVVDPRELELPSVGVLTLVDPETGRRREVQTSDRALRARYAEAAADQREAIASAIRGAGADHLVLRTDRDWLGDLVHLVDVRRRRAERPRTPQR
ncbi:MAG: DUF58 domain-containing protein [Actinomycetota bacterium]|nr:DUF58 domain-containing protein [Actinomycetota bacterium]